MRHCSRVTTGRGENEAKGLRRRADRVSMKRFDDRKYKTIIYLTLEWTGAFKQRTIDAMDGFNQGHALSRARDNWPDAAITVRYPAARVAPLLP